MTIDLKYPGVLLIISLFLVYFIVKFYLMKADLKTKNKFLFFSQKYVFFSLLLLLIFEPVLTKISYDERTEKRLLLFDNSRSVALNNPTDTILFKEIANGVLKDSSFLAYTFGDGIKRISDVKQLDFNDRFTKISTNEMNDLIKNSISKENIKSVIIFGDGNFNDADNFSLKNNLPVNIIYGSLKYSESDIFLSDLIYTDNPAGEEETRFSAVVGYNGRIKNGDFTLNIYEKGKIIKTVRQNIPDPDTFVTVKAELPKLSGDFREIEFSINPLSDEKNIFNNKKSAYQRKLSSTGNFLIIANSPSLDLSFFIKLLKSNGYNFSLVYENALSDTIDTKKYKSLISFGTPTKYSSRFTLDIFGKFSSCIIFLNQKTDFAKIENYFGTGLNNFKYVPFEGKLIEMPSGEGSFLLTRASNPVIINKLPEVTYNTTFFPDEKKFRPMLSISNSLKSKAVYQFKTGGINKIIVNFSSFWKLLFNDDGDNFGKFALNLLDQTALSESPERIKINTQKSEYYSGEKIIFSGKIFDENMRALENASAEVFVNENHLETKFSYDRKEYLAEMFISEPGIYSAQIRLIETGNKITGKVVNFKIIENDMETQTIGADTAFIKSFTGARDGMIIPLSNAGKFINENSNIKQTVKSVSTINLTRNIYFFLMLILAFLIELAYRKYKDLP